MSSRALGIAVLMGCLALSGPFWSSPGLAAEKPRNWNLPTRDWFEGPVRYILSHDEDKKYRSLSTETERSRFIEDFWARRDEDPSTPANEFEIRFWKRVDEANHLFRDAPYPGWKTDRGKLYVLLGAPDEIRQGQATGSSGKEIPYLVWIYHQPRFQGMERDTEIRFRGDDSGEFHMTDRLLTWMERLTGASTDLAYRAAAAQKPPEPRQLLDTIAAEHPSMNTGRFRTHYDFFKAADGSTSVLLTLGVRPKGEAVQTAPAAPIWKVFARLADAAAAYDLVEAGSFRTADSAQDVDGFRLYQGRISVPPGFYSVFYGIQDSQTSELFSLSDRLLVPDFSPETFSISGLTLAARLEPAGQVGPDQPFLIGRMLMIPKMDSVYRAGADLAYYFQVYHPAVDPATGQASLDLVYQFYQAEALQKTGEPSFKPIGEPLTLEKQSGLVHGHAIPLTGWPAGEFKVRVQVRDRITGETLDAETRFSVR